MQKEQANSIFEELHQEQLYYDAASLGQRFVNSAIDTFCFMVLDIIGLVVLSLALALAGRSADDIKALLVDYSILFALLRVGSIVLFYTFVEVVFKGRSPGKFVTGTVVLNEDLTPIGWKTGFKRSLARIVPFEPVSLLAGHAWHDRWSKTVVIKKGTIGGYSEK